MSAHTFDVSGYTGTATLTSVNNQDTLLSTDDANFTLTNGLLSRSDGAEITLVGINRAQLTATSDDTFNVTGWTGTATLIGTGGQDTLISWSGNDQTLTDTSLVVANGGTFTLAGITAADLSAGAGNIVLNAASFSGSVSLYGGSGADTLLAGSGDDYLDAGMGQDSLVGGSGLDILDGAEGAGDTFLGGSGQDTIWGSQGPDSVNGGSGSDVIYAGPVASFLSGGSGADTIVGGSNNDTICGNGGADVLVSGGADNVIYADNPANTGDTGAVSYLYGTYLGEPGAGTDTLYGGRGNDYLFGDGDTLQPGGAGSIVDNSLATNPNPTPPSPSNPDNGPFLPPSSSCYFADRCRLPGSLD